MIYSPILVTGGTGKTGRRVVERLQAKQIPVRIGSRSAAIPFDWKNRSTWEDALRGIKAVYITYQPDLAVPGALEDIAAFSAQAVAMGVQRLVLLSGRGEDEAQACERRVQAAGVEWTIVRASWFNQNFDENFLLEPIRAGLVALPAGDVLEPFIDADDIADVVTAALTSSDHSAQVYELTGPRLMTFGQAIAEIAAASGRTIPYVPISAADYRQGMQEAGIPDDYSWLVDYLFTTVLDGRNASLTADVQRVLGRPARDFSVYASTVAATGIWNMAPSEQVEAAGG